MDSLASVCLSVCIREMGRTTLALSTSQVGIPQRGAVRPWDVTAQHAHSREEGWTDVHQDGGGVGGGGVVW